jgi:hypothetical protein
MAGPSARDQRQPLHYLGLEQATQTVAAIGLDQSFPLIEP